MSPAVYVNLFKKIHFIHCLICDCTSVSHLGNTDQNKWSLREKNSQTCFQKENSLQQWLEFLHDSSSCDSLPWSDEVLSQVDGDRCAGDGDVTVTGAVDLTANLDLSPRYLSDLVYLGALPPDDWADQLWGGSDRALSLGFISQEPRYSWNDSPQEVTLCLCSLESSSFIILFVCMQIQCEKN